MKPTHLLIPVSDLDRINNAPLFVEKYFPSTKYISLSEEDIDSMCTKAHLLAYENSDNKQWFNGNSFDKAYKQALKDLLNQ
jgi:hypothetical protein